MTKELFLKTVFSCMACDGDIAKEEVTLVKQLVENSDVFEGIDVENLLNVYINQINENSKVFLNEFLNELKEANLTKDQELVLVDLAFKIIESDNVIEYSEIKFFKKIRAKLSITDAEILELYPDKEEFLQPDIYVAEEEWEDLVFSDIDISRMLK